MRSNTAAVLLSVLLFTTSALSMGCLTELHALPGSGGIIGAELIRQDEGWSFARGCYWDVEYQVFNSGSSNVSDVRLHVESVDDRTGVVRDAKDLFIGTLASGESRSVLLQLDGECTHRYGLRVSVSAG